MGSTSGSAEATDVGFGRDAGGAGTRGRGTAGAESEAARGPGAAVGAGTATVTVTGDGDGDGDETCAANADASGDTDGDTDADGGADADGSPPAVSAPRPAPPQHDTAARATPLTTSASTVRDECRPAAGTPGGNPLISCPQHRSRVSIHPALTSVPPSRHQRPRNGLPGRVTRRRPS